MAKIFQLSVFMNFIIVGIGIGALRKNVDFDDLLLIFLAYFLVYSFLGITFLSNTDFLVPVP